jgi:hypothetical protein
MYIYAKAGTQRVCDGHAAGIRQVRKQIRNGHASRYTTGTQRVCDGHAAGIRQVRKQVRNECATDMRRAGTVRIKNKLQKFTIGVEISIYLQ